MIRFINVTEDMVQTAHDLNNKRIEDRYVEFCDEGKLLNEDEIVMVRTTDGLPRMGYVEAPYRYIEPLSMDSPLGTENLEESGAEDSASFDLNYLRFRKTTHWALNALVDPGHSGGSFDGRDFIIIEPFTTHVEDENLISLLENDTYFNGDIKLSDQASILVSKENYEVIKNDADFIATTNDYDVVVYEGDSESIVEVILAEKGFLYGSLNAWGFTTWDKREKEFNDLFEASRKEFNEQLNLNSANHAHSESYKEEKKEESENMKESIKLLSETISRLTGILDGENKELIEELQKVSIPLNSRAYYRDYDKAAVEELEKEKNDKLDLFELRRRRHRTLEIESEGEKKVREGIDLYSLEYYQIPSNSWPDEYFVLRSKDECFCIKSKEAIRLIGLDTIKQATDIVNQTINEKCQQYRQEKDKELVQAEQRRTTQYKNH